MIKTKYVQKRQEANASQFKVVNHVDQERNTFATSQIERTISDEWDRAEEYICVKCKEPFNSLKDRIPYMLPCQHNACETCIKKGDEDRTDFACPVDFTIIEGI